MLLAKVAGRIVLEVGLEDGRATRLALPVGALVQAHERPVDPVEHGRRPGQFRLVALLHERQGSGKGCPKTV